MIGLGKGFPKRQLLPFINTLLWSIFLWVGIILRQGVVEQRVTGYPSQAQTINFVVLPAIMTGINFIILFFCKKISISILLIITIIQIPLFFLILMIAGGGV
jgi:hypothetical protein